MVMVPWSMRFSLAGLVVSPGRAKVHLMPNPLLTLRGCVSLCTAREEIEMQ